MRGLIIQLREMRDEFPSSLRDVVDALTRETGLFPYLDRESALDERDLLVRETLRQTGLGDERIVFHAAQADVYARLIEGNNVILSAPTSFGKSLLIDALLASGRYDNVLVVVPTLALIDETRRRLSARRTGHKIITHPSQPLGPKNALILTAERVLEFDQLPSIELFVLDEFYKLGAADERALVLNQVFYAIRRQGIQYYLLGPNVEGLDPDVGDTAQSEFLRSEQTTVALRFHNVEQPDGAPAALLDLCTRLKGPTLVYCQSPNSAHRTARMLLGGGLGQDEPALAAAADWVSANYHAEWVVALALRRGIGIHHGQLPRALGQFLVKAFDDGRLRFLLCTGTLIEGVNTQAKNVVVYDKKRPGNKKMDAFTFRNISGRSGRMFRHFSGDVYLFGSEPEDSLPTVDIPILSQGDDVPTSLLQQLDPADLSDRSRERLEPLDEQHLLWSATLRSNTGLDVENQLQLARDIHDNASAYQPLLAFTGMPNYSQLELACELIWTHFGKRPLSGDYVRTSSQLTRQLMNFSMTGTTKALIDEAITTQKGEDLDKTIAGVCAFVRNVASFTFPIRMRALDRIQRDVLTRSGLRCGDYRAYIARVEGLFLDSPLLALDEYGVPPELATKLKSHLAPDGDLDGVLSRLSKLRPDSLGLSEFEREMLTYAQSGL